MAEVIRPQEDVDFFNKCLVKAHSVDDINFDQLASDLENNSFACLRGLVSPKEVMDCREQLVANFSADNDNPTIGEEPHKVRTLFQKLLVGGCTQSNLYLSRMFRTFYTPFWEKDLYKIHEPLKRLVVVRNRLTNQRDDFAMDRIEDNGMWTAARIHQFPTGGGFFNKHRDTVLIEVNKEKDLNFYQVILVMSKKGEDFEKGGGFVEANGKDVDLDDFTEMGDIIIYSSANFHGVFDIDPHKRLDLNAINGRLTGFVSLYKVLNG